MSTVLLEPAFRVKDAYCTVHREPLTFDSCCFRNHKAKEQPQTLSSESRTKIMPQCSILYTEAIVSTPVLCQSVPTSFLTTNRGRSTFGLLCNVKKEMREEITFLFRLIRNIKVHVMTIQTSGVMY